MLARARLDHGGVFCTLALALGTPACTAADRDRASPIAAVAEGGASEGGAAAPATADSTEAGAPPASPATPASPEPPELDVPRAAATVVPAGHFRLSVWERAVNTHTLLDEQGRGAVPVSEARLLWRAGELYVRFYAGDLDLEMHAQKHDAPVWNDDSVAFAFGGADGRRRIIQISPTGVIADGICPGEAVSLDDARCDLTWESHVRAAADYDGTPNHTGDFDEEWSVEAAIPLASIAPPGAGAGTRIPFTVSRCEVGHDGRRSCGAWGGAGA